MSLKLSGVDLNYGSCSVLRGISFELAPREKLAIVGPSGCGKSSLLYAIAGLRRPQSGEIVHNGQPVLGPSRQRVMIFQSHALFPWKTAVGNVEFALRARGASEVRERALHYLQLVGLRERAFAYPSELSGGMQQRVGIARALAAEPELLLLDEPFAALDALTRDAVLEDVLRVTSELGKSLILVTHSLEEALFIGDRVLVMSPAPGRILHAMNTSAARPDRVIDCKHAPEFRNAERALYDLLSEGTR